LQDTDDSCDAVKPADAAFMLSQQYSEQIISTHCVISVLTISHIRLLDFHADKSHAMLPGSALLAAAVFVWRT
jgi:hypothetical protein